MNIVFDSSTHKIEYVLIMIKILWGSKPFFYFLKLKKGYILQSEKIANSFLILLKRSRFFQGQKSFTLRKSIRINFFFLSWKHIFLSNVYLMLPTGHRIKTFILPNIFGIELSATMSAKLYKEYILQFWKHFILLSLCSKDEKSVKKKIHFTKKFGFIFNFNPTFHVFTFYF